MVAHSVPIISRNYIVRNRSAGILLLDYSGPRVSFNLISENQSVGMLMRDNWEGTIEHNSITGNEIEFATVKPSPLSAQLLQANNIRGELRIPKAEFCSLV